ncbi:endolytic transglycosylase MltG [Candidatus Curtissbacteria bacterium]|nr:endolytic transglycosylase MltG [Candidatus Curtissbacteria bacterium]
MRRPKLIKDPNKLIIFALIFILLVLTPVGLNQYYNYLLKPTSSEESPQIFIVKPGQPLAQIAQNLKQARLVKSSLAFRLLVSQMGIAKNIQAGDFRLSAHMSSREIAAELTHGAIDIWITIPEGFRVEEIANRVEEKLKFGGNDKFQFDKKEDFNQQIKSRFAPTG